MASPELMLITVAGIWLRALSFMTGDSFVVVGVLAGLR
jgi:hypothetical protein